MAPFGRSEHSQERNAGRVASRSMRKRRRCEIPKFTRFDLTSAEIAEVWRWTSSSWCSITASALRKDAELLLSRGMSGLRRSVDMQAAIDEGVPSGFSAALLSVRSGAGGLRQQAAVAMRSNSAPRRDTATKGHLNEPSVSDAIVLFGARGISPRSKFSPRWRALFAT